MYLFSVAPSSLLRCYSLPKVAVVLHHAPALHAHHAIPVYSFGRLSGRFSFITRLSSAPRSIFTLPMSFHHAICAATAHGVIPVCHVRRPLLTSTPILCMHSCSSPSLPFCTTRFASPPDPLRHSLLPPQPLSLPVSNYLSVCPCGSYSACYHICNCVY